MQTRRLEVRAGMHPGQVEVRVGVHPGQVEVRAGVLWAGGGEGGVQWAGREP